MFAQKAPTCPLFCQQEAAAPTPGWKGGDPGGELPAQTPASERPLPEIRVPDILSAERTGDVVSCSFTHPLVR